MASMEECLIKRREERIAREQARIQKLRELNLKKYGSNDQLKLKCSTSSVAVTATAKPKPNISTVNALAKSKSDTNNITNNNINGVGRPSTVPVPKRTTNKDVLAGRNITANNMKPVNYKLLNNIQPSNTNNKLASNIKPPSTNNKLSNNIKPPSTNNNLPNNIKPPTTNNKLANNNKPTTSTQLSKFNEKNVKAVNSKADVKPKVYNRRKTVCAESKTNCTTTKESVFDRLSKPNAYRKQKQTVDNVTKLKTDPNFLRKVVKNSEMIINRRYTVTEHKTIRRSISAMHWKRNESNDSMSKWASIGEKIDQVHLKNINEDDSHKNDPIVSAVKSERKEVRFCTPLPLYLSNQRPEDLLSKLQSWLQNQGKSLDSYYHLQCFGIDNSNYTKPLDGSTFNDDDENKENIALEHDSDNESFLENNNRLGSIDKEEKAVILSEQKWRRASSITDDTSDYNESFDMTITSADTVHRYDDLVIEALNDLTKLLREGFDWEQCARWLRSIRERHPAAPDLAPYWECRAALEERRGDLNATVQCLEEALAKGTKQSVVEANLDNLLDKFMQLKISPTGGQKRLNPKLLDVKNVFKSSVLRFAVQKAKLRQSNGTPKLIVTPVRRSHRLSRIHTPLRICTTIHQAKELGAEFVPNKALVDTP